MNNYELFIERIAKAANLELEEVDRRVEAKKAKLSGLISKEGAAQIIAAELGINFEEQNLKISELVTGMRKANTIGKIINLFPVREYEKNGRKGKVANFQIADNTGNTRIVLWDTKHIELIENKTLQQNDVIEIKNASVREGELHLSGFSELTKSSETITEVQTEQQTTSSSLAEARQGQTITTKATIVQLFPPRFYFVCPECGKKVLNEGETYTCAEHGTVTPQDKAILNMVLDDGEESMRMVMFSDQINKIIPEQQLKETETYATFTEEWLGEEVEITGTIKRNQLFNNLEIIANNIEKVNVETYIKELETPTQK